MPAARHALRAYFRDWAAKLAGLDRPLATSAKIRNWHGLIGLVKSRFGASSQVAALISAHGDRPPEPCAQIPPVRRHDPSH